MSDLFDKFIKDLHIYCKNIDNFHKDILAQIDDKNKDVIEFLTNMFNAKGNKDKDVIRKKPSDGGIFNPFDE
jgi:hypothetical protein